MNAFITKQIIKNGNKNVFDNNNPTLYDYSSIIHFNESFMIKLLKTNEYIANFQMNDCFENFTHRIIVFAHYFDRYR